MASPITKTAKGKSKVEEEEVTDADNDEDEESDDDDDDDDDEESDDDDDDEEEEDTGEISVDDVLIDIRDALRDAMEAQVSVTVEKKRILLDLDDDSRWTLTIKRRD